MDEKGFTNEQVTTSRNVVFSCPYSLIPWLSVHCEWPPLLNLGTKSDFWALRPFRYLIKVTKGQKDNNSKRQRPEREWDSFALMRCFCQLVFLDQIEAFLADAVRFVKEAGHMIAEVNFRLFKTQLGSSLRDPSTNGAQKRSWRVYGGPLY